MSEKMRIALATAAHYPDLSPDDQLLRDELVRRGHEAVPVIWDGEVDWHGYDVVVARSIWDYHLKYQQFLEWLAMLDAIGVRVHNATPLLRHTADKRYLLELEDKHVRITPTRVFKRGAAPALATILAERRWPHAVVKPTVASSGYETWFANTPCTEQDEERFAHQVARMDVLVQEFVPGVRLGEFSFVFIGGEYTHSVIKLPAVDEFRVHIEHGGSVEAFMPPEADITWVRRVVAILPAGSWTYARVDGVRSREGMVLMELELLDPELFLKYNPAACQRFADAIVRGRPE